MDVGIIGMGFVGGTTAKIFNEVHNVFPYDKYKAPYNTQKSLDELALNSEVVFICVPTPMKPSGSIDYSSMHNSLDTLLESVNSCERNPLDILITIRSTAVSGTSDKFAQEYKFRFAVNPEFLKEKTAFEDMKNPSRIVIGTNDSIDEELLCKVYKPLFPNAEYVFTDRKTAEMIKYASNAMLASQIAIANEIFDICNSAGIDYNIVKQAMLLDSRIGKNISVPGHDGERGFGGKCLPKDLNGLIYLARELDFRPYLLEEVWRKNSAVRNKKDWLDIKGATSNNSYA